MTTPLRRAIAGLLLAGSVTAHAQIQMCKDAHGRKVFSDLPCGADATPVSVSPASGSLAIHPDARMKVEYYDIRGTSWEALRRQIDAKGPEGWWGMTNSGTRYEISAQPAGGQCAVEWVKVTSDARVRLPSWANRFEGSARLQSYWDGAFRTLDLHERGHVEINLEGSKEIERALKAIEPQPTCDAVIAEARRRFTDIRAAVARRQQDYDADTDHGRRQWTPYKD